MQWSGTVLMDLGPGPMFKMQIALSIMLAATAAGFAINPDSRVRAFAYAAWSVWFFVMARGRFQVRDRGIVTASAVLLWERIIECFASDDRTARLELNTGFQRTVDLRLPADLRDDFIEMVNSRKRGSTRRG
jgi:hypothetical protein